MHIADRKAYKSYHRRKEAIDNIIILHGFIMVLAVGNAIRGFVEPKLSSDDQMLNFNISIDLFHFLICVVFVMRFLLGDRSYLRNYKPKVEYLYILDMMNIISASVLIAYASFLVRNPIYLYQMLFVIIALEVIWLWVRKILRRCSSKRIRSTNNISGEDQAGIGVSHVVSILTLLGVAVVVGLFWPRENDEIIVSWANFNLAVSNTFQNQDLNILILTWIFGLNTLLDVILRIRSYFGGPDLQIFVGEQR